MRGDFPLALQHAHRLVEMAEDLGLPYWVKGAYLSLATNHQLAGDPRAALRAADKAEEYPSLDTMPGGTYAEALYELGQHERALEMAAEATALDRLVYPVLSPTLALARLLMRSGGTSRAAEVQRILADLESRATARGSIAFLPFIARERAELARLLGDDTARERELREAHRLFVEMEATGHAERVAAELGP
jgi:hypothetical protein